MTKIGIIITILYVAVIGLFRWNSFPELATMPLNEFGDFFAGVFGPLMLFWLILGYMQQQSELRQNTKALELQADELKRSVEQHKELVKATKEQVQADLKALEIEEIRSLREAHPHFTITGAGKGMSQSTKKTFNIHLLNSGQPASGVFFTTDPEIKQIPQNSIVHYFETGKKHKLTWDSHTSGEAPEELKLVINCKDSNTSNYTKVFHMVLDENDQYHLTDSGWVS
ncbi:hypothetical protein [Pseudidiomarina sp.]|uniref:hypothetical protein n=1 Tax=Pseudidiomarina sp. TaxID=2081707 RepID=UPI003A9741D8